MAIPKLTKSIFITIGVWVAVTLLIYSFGYGEAFPVLRGYWPLASLLIAAILILLCLIAFFINKPKLAPAWAILLVVITAYFSIKMFRSWGGRIHFQIHKSRYEKIVQGISATQNEEERKKICSGDCWIRSSDPLQVGFHFAHGFLNWHDIVYDPSRQVKKPERPMYGYLVYSDHLSGDWYLCHFAD